MQKKSQPENPRSSPPPNMSVFLFFRLAASAYLIYLIYQMVTLYKAGGPDAPSPLLLTLSVLLFGGCAIAIVWISLRQYKRFLADAAAARAGNCEEPAEAEALGETASDAILKEESCKTEDETRHP